MKFRILSCDNPLDSLVISCESAEGRMTRNGHGYIIDSCVIARNNGQVRVYSGYRLADEAEGLFV